MTEAGMSESAMARAFSTLRLFKRFCDRTEVDKILPIATSAVREAANGPLFVQRVAREIGISLQVLGGEREAYYDTIGALDEVPLEAGAVVDNVSNGVAMPTSMTSSPRGAMVGCASR
jgi:exopolyphosphatase/guanosine-5'-triphosphate,3'-diphosphate pyrophosphatase